MKNPYLNAVAAIAYIALIVNAIHATASITVEETILIPIVMLGLFVLSAAIMGYLFILEPARMYFEGQKREAIIFFGKTVGTFAVCVLIVAASLLFFVI